MVESRGVQSLEGFLAQCEVRIDASPDVVFDFLVDEEKMLLWKGVRAELDPRPGGIFKVEVTPGWIALGEYTEIDRPRLVAFTWGWEGEGSPVPVGSSVVRITLEPDGANGEQTLLSLVHSGLPSDEMVNAHNDGWTHFLARLQIAAPGGDPGPDPWITSQS